METVRAFAGLLPLTSESFDLVVCRLAAHHFCDLPKAVAEMARLAKPGGYVAVIDLEGNGDPEIDALNHDIEVLHDPTHLRSYTAGHGKIFSKRTDWQLLPQKTGVQRFREG